MAQKDVKRILKILQKKYPEVSCSLDYHNPFELLVATVLSAQCTDKRVNQVTPLLFERFGDAFRLACAPLHEVESLIKSINFYHNKAKALIQASEQIVERHQGQVPGDLASLISLSGVGRKTANVILGNAFGVPSLVVDTHVKRLTHRLGLTKKKEPEKIEKELMELLPVSEWIFFSHRLIAHGRSVCTAKKPRCGGCDLQTVCDAVVGEEI